MISRIGTLIVNSAAIASETLLHEILKRNIVLSVDYFTVEDEFEINAQVVEMEISDRFHLKNTSKRVKLFLQLKNHIINARYSWL